MRGTIWVQIGDHNPLEERGQVSGVIRYTCQCANHGHAYCEINEIEIEIAPQGHLALRWTEKLEKPYRVDFRTAFRHIKASAVNEVSNEQIRLSEIKVTLIDSIGTRYLNTKTEVSNVPWGHPI
jgi:threonyl-tRNA synthetase